MRLADRFLETTDQAPRSEWVRRSGSRPAAAESHARRRPDLFGQAAVARCVSGGLPRNFLTLDAAISAQTSGQWPR
jgi:hypothetical protein